MLANLLATEDRICRALGVASLDELADRIGRLLDVSAPDGWFKRLKGGAQPAALWRHEPREVKSAACQQIVRLAATSISTNCRCLVAVRVFRRPSRLRSLFSAEPDSHLPVSGRFDLQRIDATRLAVCWAAHDDHARLLGDYRRGISRCRWPW